MSGKFSLSRLKRKTIVRLLIALGVIIVAVGGVVENFEKICDGINKLYAFIKEHHHSTNEKNSLESITNAAEQELSVRSATRFSDWLTFRNAANDKWITGVKVPAGPEAGHIIVNLVPIPGEPTFTISQEVIPGLTSPGMGFGGDGISVNIHSDAPGGVGFGSADRDGKPLFIKERDGGTIMYYMEDSWNKKSGRFEMPHDVGIVTIMFRDRKYVIRPPAGLNSEIYEDSGFWQKQGAPLKMRIKGPMSLEIYGIEPKELFSNTNPPDWYIPLPSKETIIESLKKISQEQRQPK